MHNPFHSNVQDLNGSLLRQRHSLAQSSRSLKRAKSVRDAFPPCTPKRSSSSSTFQDSRRKHSSQLRMLTRCLTDEPDSGSGIFDGPQCDTPTDSESTFDFGAASDSESLPDLSDCNSSPGSVQSAITPTKCPSSHFFDNINASVEVRKRLFQKEVNSDCSVFQDSEAAAIPPFNSRPSFDGYFNPFVTPPRSKLSIQTPDSNSIVHAEEPKTAHAIFSIPELVYKILEYADAQYTLVPKESSPVRRSQSPSQRHAPSEAPTKDSGSLMHSCLLVNKLFNTAARQIMSKRVLFSSENSFAKFSQNKASYFEALRPRTFVLNKLFYAKQASLERVASSINCSELEWLEIFMCPKLRPTPSIFHPSLKTLVVTGSKVFDDELLTLVAERCPNLEVVDVRACELITDCGVYALAKRCRRLRSINFGRKRKGHLITDHSILPLVNNNRNLQTVGLAGCSVTDRSIWEIAVNCGKHLERLSLNNCPYISNQSLPAILNHNLTPKLSVLEIKYIESLTNFDPIVNFKRMQISNGIIMLIETCDTLQARLRECEQKMDSEISQRIFRDISEWANSSEDGDLPFGALRAARTQIF